MLPHPQLAASVNINGLAATAGQLSDWQVNVTAATLLKVTSIADGTVSTAGPHELVLGQEVRFNNITGLDNLANGRAYYVIEANQAAGTFTVAARLGGLAIFDAASTGEGLAYAKPVDAQNVGGLTDANGALNLAVPEPGYYRVAVAPRSTGYLPQPLAGNQILSNAGAIVQYVQVGQPGLETKVDFEFDMRPIISGTVYSNLAADGQRSVSDPGVGGIRIYLDENGNGVFNVLEPSVLSRDDGSYDLFHVFADGESSYTTAIGLVTPAGWKQPATLPPVTITPQSPQVLGNDFLAVELVTLSGTVFHAANGNGRKDAGEAGVAGEPVQIRRPDGSNVTVTSGPGGSWDYANEMRGSYQVAYADAANVTTPLRLGALTVDRPNIARAQGEISRAKIALTRDPSTGMYQSRVVAQTQVSGRDVAQVFQFNPSGQLVSSMDADVPAGLALSNASLAPNADQQKWLVTFWTPQSGGNMYQGTWGSQVGIPESPVESTIPVGSLPTVLREVWTGNDYVTGSVAAAHPDGQVFTYTLAASGEPGTLRTMLPRKPMRITSFISGRVPGEPWRFADESVAAVVQRDGRLVAVVEDGASGFLPEIDLPGEVCLDLISGDFDGDGRQDLAVYTRDALGGGNVTYHVAARWYPTVS